MIVLLQAEKLQGTLILIPDVKADKYYMATNLFQLLWSFWYFTVYFCASILMDYVLVVAAILTF